MDKKDIQKHAIEKRKSRDKTRRKRQILEAAGKVFLQKGYINATMDDISLEVGLTKPTIYKYFKNIDHMCYLLFVPLIDSMTQNLARLEKDVLAGKYQSGAQLIHDIFQTFYEGYKISPDIFRLLQFFQQSGAIWNLEEELRESLNEKGRHNARITRRAYRIAMDQGLLKKYEAIVALDVIYGAFLGIIQWTDIRSHRNGFKAGWDETEESRLVRLQFMEKLAIETLALN